MRQLLALRPCERVHEVSRASAERSSIDASHARRMSRSTIAITVADAAASATSRRSRARTALRALSSAAMSSKLLGRPGAVDGGGDLLHPASPRLPLPPPNDRPQHVLHERRRRTGGRHGRRIRPLRIDQGRLGVRDPQKLGAGVRRCPDISLVKREGPRLRLAALNGHQRTGEKGIGRRRMGQHLQRAGELERFIGHLRGEDEATRPRVGEREAPQFVDPVRAVPAALGVEGASGASGLP